MDQTKSYSLDATTLNELVTVPTSLIPSSQSQIDDKKKNSSSEEILKWARILKITENLNITGETFETIQVAALTALGIDITSKESATCINVIPPQLPNQSVTPLDAHQNQKLYEERALEQRLRHLVQASAPWGAIKPIILRILQQTESAEMTARCLEISMMQNAFQIGEELLNIGLHRFPSSYFLIHAAIRNRMAMQNLRTRACRILDKLLLSYKEFDSLTPLERLYIFLALAEGPDEATAFMFFKRNFRVLLGVAESQKENTGIPPSEILLSGGKIALSLGYITEARDLLSQIKDPGPDYETALRILLDHRFLERSQDSTYTQKLALAPDTRERLLLLKEFLDNTRKLGGFLDKKRPELNDILANPLPLVGENPEDWARLSKLLVAYGDLENLLPNLLQLFRDHALTYHAPLYDTALWEGPRQNTCSSARDRYWTGVGLIHYYVAEGPGAENQLWDAKKLIEEARKDFHKAHLMIPGVNIVSLPHEWKELHKYAFSYTSKNSLLLEIDRTRMLEQLKICQNEQTVTRQDIEGYLAQPFCPKTTKTSPEIYTRLLNFARNAPALEYQILLRRGALTHLTNQDLHKIWRLSIENQTPDLSWRSATILKYRGALVKQVEYAWNISGEKRSVYPIMLPTPSMAMAVLKDFTPAAHRFIQALITVGPQLPELLGILDPESRTSKPKQYAALSPEYKTLTHLTKIPWLPQPTKKYLYFEGHSNLDQLVPPFASYLPANSWCFVLNYIAESLGIFAWKWSVKDLGEKMASLMAKIAIRQNAHKQPANITKWLKSLSPEQKTAWQDHSVLSRSLSDSEAQEALGIALIRWSTLIVQNHLQALESLNHMKAPAFMIWDLEQFILSQVYSDIRSVLNTKSRIMVPIALQSLPSIIEAPSQNH
jgi:hypothetical protein